MKARKVLKGVIEHGLSSSACQRTAEARHVGGQSDGEIEDWELWADPREIERRKAERARARVPPEERRKQVSICLCSCA